MIKAAPDDANVAIFPPLLLAIFFIVGGLLEWLIPLARIDTETVGNLIGTILLVLSFLLAGWAIRTFRIAGEHEDVRKATHSIVTTGPFTFSRNPMYLAFLWLYLGVAFIWNIEWFMVLSPLLVAALYFAVIKREEAYLKRKFGNEYLKYKSRVRRWL